ncbi:hypothetical protein PV332_10420 [Streptomyces scabiei]|uniref:hypothetical protein n=1 Tax=Streptomyces scabiei TaxID=1930 RepID=UPI0029BAF622|nr:hypothetical protein [Streptomyces scabiei]MDX2575894.1 hypothetical protein [Streptomyces scabiei]MDX2885633.1 hypothetical protein [Streptomyces scabiei]MDX2997639.1 hypothetical protein [Streptomyces scabiei]MDX3032940.1 hypothetical protein [Streptomyces scabiei]MDX3051281.1 hypothetical protein [Streptomyces scabiei]
MPDVEAVLAPWAEATFGVFSAAETPADLEDRLPVIRVERIGGADDRFSLHPRVAVDVFAASPDEARTLSNSVRDALLFLRGTVNGAVVRDVRCDSGPSRQPWANEAVHRRGATYTVSLRDA